MRWSPLALIFVFACLSAKDPDEAARVDASVPVERDEGGEPDELQGVAKRVPDSSQNPNPFGLTLFGRIEDAMKGDGVTVDLKDVQTVTGHGVGLLADRDGVVVLTNGRAWTAKVKDGKAAVAKGGGSDTLGFFVGTPEPDWADHDQDSNLDSMVLGSRIANWLEQTQTPDTAPVPFRVEGTFDKLVLHVPDGSKLKGTTTIEQHAETGVTLEFAAEEAVLVGLHSPGHEGEFTHPGETILAYALVGDPPQIGHVDAWTAAPGATLKLPAR
jgi:hypothetical protein